MKADYDLPFPEGQLVANGLPLKLAQKIGKDFRAGKDMQLLADADLTPSIKSIITRLENHSQYGKHQCGSSFIET